MKKVLICIFCISLLYVKSFADEGMWLPMLLGQQVYNDMVKKGLKLTLVQVKKIKQTLANPKRKITYRQMAEKYGISEMAITRIKNGENWGYVTV